MAGTATVAIHRREGSYSDRWIGRCAELGIPYALVDCYAPDIVSRLASSRALLWHFTHARPRDLLMARNVLTAAELLGLEVFPDRATSWHFDDKIAQKYLLEAVGAPLARSWVWYDLESANAFIDGATLPLVFKLRRGAGSVNVRLVRTRSEARALARRAFDGGFAPTEGPLTDARRRVGRARTRHDLAGMLLRVPATLIRMNRARQRADREKGYVYFQEFLPGNAFDMRVTVIGRRAFAFTRNVRPGDFRASGSGSIDYDVRRIDPRCVTTAFEVARRAGSQSMAFDFVRDASGAPRILEVSYGFLSKAVYACPGHWDERLGWHEGHVWPEDAILEDLLERLEGGIDAASM
jgi:glutathione synthase/RimK-type ligase-like ATP-grasp enzyme